MATIKQVSIMGIISVGGVANGTSHRYGDITGRYVIYRGDDDKVDGVQYLNVEEFAKKEFKSFILVDFAHTSKVIRDLFDDTSFSFLCSNRT